MEERIRAMFEESAALTLSFGRENATRIAAMARRMADVLRRGGKILFCGNGGSAADAQHLAAEFVNRFQRDRRALAALALTTDTSVLTSIGNDSGFDRIFSRQVEALARRGDLLVAISTSGNSPNVLRAMEVAQEMGLTRIGLTGRDGGALAPMCDVAVIVPTESMQIIEDAHLATLHAIFLELCLPAEEQ